MTGEQEFAARVRELFLEAEERSAHADEVYRALKGTQRLTKQRAVAYYCRNRRRCLLLDVVPFPTGYILHVPRYKMSPELNQQASSEPGRRANTEDGDRHWVGHSFYADQAGEHLTLTCDHVRTTIDKTSIIEDLERGVREVRIPR